MIKFRKDKLRVKAEKIYNEYQAIYSIINAATVQIRKDFEASAKAIVHFNKNELSDFITKIKGEMSNLRKHYGVKVPNSTILELVEKAKSGPKKKLLLIPKYLLNDIFSRYTNIIPDFNEFPNHMRIGLDLGVFRKKQGTVELYLLEAIIFENMCALFNLLKKYQSEKQKADASKKDIKTYNALQKSTVVFAFFFVESYLNGIAFDFYSKNEDVLDYKTKALLTEWDSEKNRRLNLSLKEKILKYPRIIKGLEHPPVQESNSIEFDFIVNTAKLFRDSIVHASPKFDLEKYDPVKEKLFFDMTIDDVEQTVDYSIRLVERIEKEISGTTDRLWWLCKRGRNGAFPESAFK